MELWIPFVFAATLILVIPGPTILLVISQAVAHGRRSVIPLVVGVLLGDFTAMTFSLLGLGALMSTSAALFIIFKWIGAIYLVYLGIKLLKLNFEKPSVQNISENASARSLFRSSFIVTALNPKSIAFFIAFLPQFIDPLKPAIFQLTLLGGTFLILATINAALYAVFAGQLGDLMRKDEVRKWFNRCGGSVLIGAGIITATMQRST
jgi:threonine/homoserine/homoserine lactone efflux protein